MLKFLHGTSSWQSHCQDCQPCIEPAPLYSQVKALPPHLTQCKAREVFLILQEMDHSVLTEAIIQPITTPCAFNHVTKPANLPASTFSSALHQVILCSLIS